MLCPISLARFGNASSQTVKQCYRLIRHHLPAANRLIAPSEIEIVDNWEQYEVSQANAVLYSEETQEFQSLRCDTTNEYQLAISGISSAKGNTQSRR